MEANILKALIASNGNASEKLTGIIDYEKLQSEGEIFPVSDVLFNELSNSLTNLFSYKVSKEAYQRYSVRTNIIEILRGWCLLPEYLQNLPFFSNEDTALVFVDNLLTKHLKSDKLKNCDDMDILVPLAVGIYMLRTKLKNSKNCLEKVILKICQLESNEKSEHFFFHLIVENTDIELNLPCLEQMYVFQKSELIEKPLINAFICKVNSENNDRQAQFDLLINHASQSPLLFQVISSLMLHLLQYSDYSKIVLDFIKDILQNISNCCEKHKKDILDLYPRNLEYCILLLRIKPSFHTLDSKSFLLEKLQNVHTKSKEDVLILLSHFPEWLNEFYNHIIANNE